MRNRRRWADLPKELLQSIGQHLDSRVDVYRFRAVCSSWRSSISPSKQYLPYLIHFPRPINRYAFFSQASICLLQKSNSSSKCWLTKVEEYRPKTKHSTHRIEWFSPDDDQEEKEAVEKSEDLKQRIERLFADCGKVVEKIEESSQDKEKPDESILQGYMQLLMPLSNRLIKKESSRGKIRKRLNLLNYRLVELAKAYSLKTNYGFSVFGVNKVVMVPGSCQIDEWENYGVLAIIGEGKLVCFKFGDECCRVVDDKNFHYDDIVVYKGQLYVVDRWGIVSWVDSSFNLVQYSPPLLGSGSRKNLVESCGDLYVVDRYFTGKRMKWDNSTNYFMKLVDLECGIFQTKTVDVKVYKLDEEWGTWVEVKSLDDRAFVLSSECCFSICARKFDGCEGNCIYFTDICDETTDGEISGEEAQVFDLGQHKVRKTSNFPGSWIFWPPPRWDT